MMRRPAASPPIAPPMGAASPAEPGLFAGEDAAELMQMFRGQVEQFLGVWTHVWSAEHLQGGGAVLQGTQSEDIVRSCVRSFVRSFVDCC